MVDFEAPAKDGDLAEDGEQLCLLAKLAAAEQTIAQAIQAAGIDPELAAAACAALAGEYTATAAQSGGVLLAPLLREAVRTLEQRGLNTYDHLQGEKA